MSVLLTQCIGQVSSYERRLLTVKSAHGFHDVRSSLLRLASTLNIYISAQKNSFNIERFIVTELDRVISQKQLLRDKVSGKLRQQIMDPLSNRANGMYGGETIPLTDVRLQLT